MTQMKTVPSSISSDTSTQRPIDQAIKRIRSVSTLPHIAIRMIEICNQPQATAADLNRLVESDPALTSRILKCVNSAAYGLRNKVQNLQRAICYLGFKQVRDLAVSASVSEVFRSEGQYGRYDRSHLWRHLVSVAICSRMIGARCKLADFEDAFLAGLMHDFGIILMDQYCHEDFVQMMRHFPEGPEVTLVQVEQDAFGFDHTMLGARLGEKWKFSDSLVDVMRYHHMVSNYRGEHGRMLACVDVANLICSLKGRSSIGRQLLKPSLWSMDKLKFSRTDIQIIGHDLRDELQQHKELFALGKTEAA